MDRKAEQGAPYGAHTPGPWEMGGRYGLIGVEVVAHGHSLAVINRVQANALDYANEKRSKAAKNGDAAHQAERLAQRLEESLPRALADAHLIAAAPDLYGALRLLIAWDEGACITAPPQEPWKSVIEAAHAALAKAEGRGASNG